MSASDTPKEEPKVGNRFDAEEKRKLRFEFALILFAGVVGLLGGIMSFASGYFMKKEEMKMGFAQWTEQQKILDAKGREDMRDQLTNLITVESIRQLNLVSNQAMQIEKTQTNWFAQQEFLNRQRHEELKKAQDGWEERRKRELTVENLVAQVFWKEQQEILREQQLYDRKLSLLGDLVERFTQYRLLQQMREVEYVWATGELEEVKPRYLWNITRRQLYVQRMNRSYEETQSINEKQAELTSKLTVTLQTIPFYFGTNVSDASYELAQKWENAPRVVDSYEFQKAMGEILNNRSRNNNIVGRLQALLAAHQARQTNAALEIAWTNLITQMNLELSQPAGITLNSKGVDEKGVVERPDLSN